MTEIGLERLHPDLFANLKSLKALDVHGNDIKKLDIDIGSRFPNLQALDISGNLITSFPRTNNGAISKMKSINFANNPWQCNCELKWLKTVNSIRNNLNDIVCGGPDNLKFVPFVDIPDLKITCSPPRINNCGPTYITIGLGWSLYLSCELDGDPFPEVSWTRPDRKRFEFSYNQQEPYLIAENGSMKITRVSNIDRGMWTLQAFNGHGQQQHQIGVQVAVWTTTTTTTTTTTATTPDKSPTMDTKPSKTPIRNAVQKITVIAGGVGGAVLLGTVIIVVYCIKRKKRKTKAGATDDNDDEMNM